MNPIARALIVGGVFMVALGLIWQLAGRHLPLGRLPGDIAIQRDGFHFYFPIVTCLLISAVFSLILIVIRFLGR